MFSHEHQEHNTDDHNCFKQIVATITCCMIKEINSLSVCLIMIWLRENITSKSIAVNASCDYMSSKNVRTHFVEINHRVCDITYDWVNV